MRRKKVLDPALNGLIRMLTRAALRKAWKAIKTPSGAFFAVFMVAMLSFGILPTVIMSFTSPQESSVGLGGVLLSCIPTVMYLMTAALIASNSGEALLELRPAELQFVLAGPFKDSHILSYRLTTLLISWAPLSLFFALMSMPHVSSFLGAFFAIALGGSFIMLITFVFSLAKPQMASGQLTAVRMTALISILAMLLEAAYRITTSTKPYSSEMIVDAINGGWAAGLIGLVFRPFAALATSDVASTMLINLVLASGLVALAMTACYHTNAGFSELAVEGVARRRKKLARVKEGNLYRNTSTQKERKQILPVFPWLRGIGPVAWLQITSVFRRTGRLIPGVFVLGSVTALLLLVLKIVQPGMFVDFPGKYVMLIALVASAYLGFLLSMTSQIGFASSERILTWYQLLPISPSSISVGMVCGTASLVLSVQTAICLPAFVLASAAWYESIAVFYLGLAANLGLASMVNVVAAATGLRPTPQGTPDVFQGANGILFMMVLGLGMVPMCLFAFGAAAVAGGIFGFSWTLCALAAGSTLLVIQPIIWWFGGQRFNERELKAT